MKALAIVMLLSATAHAGDDLGTPLPEPTAYPAMGGLSAYVMSLDVIDVGSLPVTNRSAVLGGFGLRAYGGGVTMGQFAFYSMGTNIAFELAGDATRAKMFSLELPSLGLGYRTRDWLVDAQLVPAIQWFTQDVGMTSERDHDYTLSADLQACLQYNIAGIFSKNSAACVYVAPALYRESWFSGASFGLRLFTL
jgi:hypothetical protein